MYAQRHIFRNQEYADVWYSFNGLYDFRKEGFPWSEVKISSNFIGRERHALPEF
jgi:hypothetical protein